MVLFATVRLFLWVKKTLRIYWKLKDKRLCFEWWIPELIFERTEFNDDLFGMYFLWVMHINPKSCMDRVFTKLFQVPCWGLWVVTKVIGASVVLLQLVLGYRVTMLPRTTVVWPQSKDGLFCGYLWFQSMCNKREHIKKQVRCQYNHRTWRRRFCVFEDTT